MLLCLSLALFLCLDVILGQRGAHINSLRFKSGLMSSENVEKVEIEHVPSISGSLVGCATVCAKSKSCSRFYDDQDKCYLMESWPLLKGNSGSNNTQINVYELVTEEWFQVMILGGVEAPASYSDNVEVLDMKTMKQCSDPPKLPKSQFRGSAFVLEGQVNFAMGHGYSGPVLGSVQLDLNSNQWKETELPLPELSHFPVAQIRESWVFIIGGKNSAATYIVYGNGSIVPGPSLPHVMSRHCGIGIDEDHFFAAGGDEPDDTFVLEWSEQVWVPQAPMNIKQDLVYCETFVDKNNDLSILVGHKAFEIFSWSTRSWRTGPTMLDNIGWGQLARYDGIPYLLGGRTDVMAEKSSNIYSFDTNSETWSKIPLQMKNGRLSFGIVKIPPGIVTC